MFFNSVKSLGEYVLHCKLHWNEPRSLFKCIAAGCKHTFLKYGVFKAHFYQTQCICSHVFTCALCEHQCQTAKPLIIRV